MFKRSVVLAFMLAATPALAAGYLSGDRLFETLAGKTFIWPDKTSSTYGRSGEYHFEGTVKLDGTWRVRGNKLCVTYSSGERRCDRYVYSSKGLQLENAAGKRFLAQEVH